jgi:ABC-type enterochelin transport system permease subunit
MRINNSGEENVMEIGQKITLLITTMFAVVFIAIGGGILLHIFLPQAQLSVGMRIMFGGAIFIYGIIRAVGAIRKIRRYSRSEQTTTIDERKP